MFLLTFYKISIVESINNMPESYVIDDTKEKIGLYVPGTGFEIVSRKILVEDKVDNIIILAHNFKSFIRDSLINQSQFKGNIYVMLPKIEQL